MRNPFRYCYLADAIAFIRILGDPMRVEKSFVRNLGGLLPPAAATSGPKNQVVGWLRRKFCSLDDDMGI